MKLTDQVVFDEKSIFLDRSALAVFMDPHHPKHRKAAAFFYGLDDLQRPMITLNLMIYELHEWLRDKAGYDQAEFFLNAVRKAERANVLTIIAVDETMEQEALGLMLKHPEYELSYLDACALTMMNHLGIYRIFSFSPCFSRVSKHYPQIQVVPT